MLKKEAINFIESLGYETREDYRLGKKRIVIKKENCSIHPALLVEEIKNIDDPEELRRIIETAYEEAPDEELLSKSLLNKKYVLDNCYLAVCSNETEMGEEAVVYETEAPFNDLHTYVRVDLDSVGLEGASVAITQGHLLKLKLTRNEIYKAAKINTEKKASIRSMQEVLKEMVGTDLPWDEDLEDFFYVASSNGHHGAGIVNCKEVLENFARKHNKSQMVILPSSIHEVLIVFTNDDENFDSMVKEVNETQVELEEKLSNHGYELHF